MTLEETEHEHTVFVALLMSCSKVGVTAESVSKVRTEKKIV